MNSLAHAAGPRPGAKRSLPRLVFRYGVALSREAQLVIVAVAIFIGVTIWWLTQENRVQDWDNGLHTLVAFRVQREIAGGHLVTPITEFNTYPPLGHLVGALGGWIGGFNPASVILASNLVFVPLLAAGCYGTGTLVYGSRRAGVLAALFALGTPMIVSEFHEFLLDPQQAALVAASVWGLLASDRLRRVGPAAAAGVLTGAAMLTKQTSVIFVAGLLAVLLLRGGWRAPLGVLAYLLPLVAVAAPWYIYHRHQLDALVQLHSSESSGAAANGAGGLFPERFSRKSLGWYFWSSLNIQLLAPLLLAVLVGTALAVRQCVRRISKDTLLPEMLAGAFASWLGVTLITHKDPRYSLPALVYMAALGTGWIATARRFKLALTVALCAVVALNFIGVSAGVGGTVRLALPGAPSSSFLAERHITFYSPDGWLRGGPEHDGDVLALFRGLKRLGVRTVTFDAASSDDINFNTSGLQVLATQAGLAPTAAYNPGGLGPRDAFLLRHVIVPGDAPPCQRLNDRTGVYVVLGYAYIPFSDYTFVCPGRKPVFYKRSSPASAAPSSEPPTS